MATIHRVVTISLLVLLLSLASNVGAARPPLKELEQKSPAPSLELFDLDGKLHRLSDYRGHTVVINFWATWCPPCRAEIPAMNRAWEALRDEGVVMLAVNAGESPKRVRRFLEELPIDFTVLLDEGGKGVREWPVPGLPTTYVIDPAGRFHYRALGQREWDSAELLEQIRALGKPRANPIAAAAKR